MSNPAVCPIDDSGIRELLDRLNSPERKKATLRALGKAAGVLAAATRASLKEAGINSESDTVKRRKSVTGRVTESHWGKMRDGIWVTNDGDHEVVVTIINDPRLRWFELGTVSRVTKKGYRRGLIEPKGFFRLAQESAAEAIYAKIVASLDEYFKSLENK